MTPKVAVIGLDCADPALVFGPWLEDLPNIRRLVQSGTWGPLRSVDPPITVPAWSCMTSGHDPGELGIYGFRNRADHSYDALMIADARAVHVDRVWDRLGREGRHVVVVGVPQTSPPPEVNGDLVSCFLTGDTRRDPFTHPTGLRTEIERLVGTYQVDVRNFRSEDRDRILAEVYAMTEQRFTVCRHLLDTRPWDFFMMVEIGVDRLHHAFWRFTDPAHPRYEPGHRYADVIHSYYRYLDDEIGELLERFDDETTVLVVSDHGARPMEGAICVNEWLLREGYLVLREPVEGPTAFRDAVVDWEKTTAWGEGGYYCRLCLNVAGREPQGLVDPADYERVRDEIAARLEALGGPDGTPIGTRALRPEDLWREQRGIPPDLVVYFGDLGWRSAGSLGHGRHWTFDNDTGPDDANHDRDGICIVSGPGVPAEHRTDLTIYDIAPTILSLAGAPGVEGLRGRAIGGTVGRV
ncbi:phosphodiesterase [Baekduia soli]|uniref:Phosphodiesterase n=1 Tax=Baekduia soli TaxID=496014 RepID=A0A5B8U5P0_9ACTN|nr:alkaline phosphatase family protein [Baekduia soli]QEC48340.1 phosphodiesterase [Baekduia soli]